MQGYERPKILKLPQGEERWAPRRLPVDVGDVMMNVRMNSDKNKFIGEHVSKYSQGLNPYGEWGYPYKVNKQYRPPIIDPKFYEPISRMPVKFDSVTAGPIVKGLYEKKIAINQVAPKTIIDCPLNPAQGTNPSVNVQKQSVCREIELELKQPRASLPYHPSLPVYHQATGVPNVELDPKLNVRPQMGIHFPYHVSDQSRDVQNMRTPTHVAVQAGYKDPHTTIQITPQDVAGINENLTTVSADSKVKNVLTLDNNWRRQGPDLTPKVQTSAWFNPSYYIGHVGWGIGGNNDVPIKTVDRCHVAGQTNVSWVPQESARGKVGELESLSLGGFSGKATVLRVDQHQEYTRARQGLKTESFTPIVNNPVDYSGTMDMASRMATGNIRSKNNVSVRA